MDKISVELVVYFDGPFWAGVIERTVGDRLSVSKTVFGAEPRDYEIYAFILENYYRLSFSPTVHSAVRERNMNPKRMQREARRQMSADGIGTKSQQALQMQREQLKAERRTLSADKKESDAKRRFELRCQKKKEKHRGK